MPRARIIARRGVRTVRRARALWLGWTLAIAVAALFAWAGVWQSHRALEKDAMLRAAHAVLLHKRPAPEAVAFDAARARAYDWVAVDGHFVDAPAFLLDNQQLDGRPGVRVYRAFRTRAGATWLVDLGWVAMGGDRSLPATGAPPTVQALSGLLAPPPSSGLRLGPAMQKQGSSWLMTRVETGSIARALAGGTRLAPRVLRLDPALPVGFARDLDILPNTLTPERHRGYAVQWFGLAITVLVIALVLTFRRPRP